MIRLGRVKQDQGILVEAEKLMRDSLATNRRIFGMNMDHEDVAASLDNNRHSRGRLQMPLKCSTKV